MPVLSLEDRARAIGHFEAGTSASVVAKMFSITKKSFFRIKRKYSTFGTVSRRPGSGRPECIDQTIKNEIITLYETEPFRTAVDTAQELDVSRYKIKRVLNDVGIHARVPAKKPKLDENHKESRLRWCECHRQLTAEDWASVLFSDESSFNVNHSERHSLVYRRKNERFDQNKISERTNKGYGSVMVWGGIIGDRKTQLIRIDGRMTAEIYITHILTDNVVPLCSNNNVSFMQDNAPIHNANVTRTFLDDHNIELLDWPAISPDLNPIEHVWAFMKKELQKREKCHNSDDLFQTLNDIWNSISPQFIAKLTGSMQRRIESTMESNGGHIKY